MKICMVCPRLCHGGAERVAVSLANGFAEKEHHVSFLSDLFEEKTYDLSPSVVLMNLVSRPHPKTIKWLSAIFILRKWLKKERPDAIIGIMSLCSVIARLASIGLKIPVIATEHDSYERPESAPMSLWGKIYKFHLCKVFKCVTVLAEADKEVVGHRMNNVVVMPNPLAISPVRTTPPKKHVILSAGRVDNWHYKGFDVLIKAWGKVVESREPRVESEEWRLQIAGVWRNPETRVFLDGIAEECGVLDKIDYLGFKEDMTPVYADASIFVLSSRFEGFGLVLIEAMSQGCACIACDYKGRQREIMETLPGPPCLGRVSEVQNTKRDPSFETCETGILCPPEDVEALAAAMAKMIEDDEYRESVREKAIERSKYYSIENTVARWEELLNSITFKNYKQGES